MKARHHKDCPHVKPFLFYWEEGIDAWCPVPDNTENLVDVLCLDDGETQEIRFKRFDMTEAEMAALPEE